jgi:hypothetical protein
MTTFLETLMQTPVGELELRANELYEATRQAYPFDRKILHTIEAVIEAKKTGKPLPLEAYQ